MTRFCVIEGVDGSGKSHLTAAIGREIDRTGRTDVEVVLKDQAQMISEWPANRLAAMHALTWSYDTNEPVWEYSGTYWLYTLAAWYSLFYEQCVQPGLDAGRVVITDGWYFKHLARFRLSGDAHLIELAQIVVSSLPQPDLVMLTDPPMNLIQERKRESKPSERGAFEVIGTTDPLEEASAFADYQGRTRAVLVQLLADHPAMVHDLSITSSVTETVEFIMMQLGYQS
jgi:thymidylate kinase